MMGRAAEARVNGILRGGMVVENEFRFHAPYPVSIHVEQVRDLRLLDEDDR